MMRMAEEILSTFTDQTLNLKAMTFITEAGHFGVRFYKDGVWVLDEIYEGHSEEYAESAAENYVMEIKTL